MPDRPKRGLDPDGAFKKWTDKAQFAELVGLSGTSAPPSDSEVHRVLRDPATRREYQQLRETADQAFVELMSDAQVIGSGIPEGGYVRIPIDPSLWDILWIDYEFFEAIGGQHKFKELEFFELSVVPANVRTIPKWLDDLLRKRGQSSFWHADDYRHIALHGVDHTLSSLWAKIVQILHEAYLEDGTGWRNGKRILEMAGSQQLKMSDVLKKRKDCKLIIQSDGRGMYRLALPHSTEAS
jgi:hypothetical protein